MPAPVPNNKQLRAKIKLIVLFCVFGLPLLFALTLAKMSENGLPQFIGTSNYGDLIEPVVPLTTFNLRTASGDQLSSESLLGKWTLVYLTENDCGPFCQQQIYAMRQLNLMVGKEAHRIQRLLIYQQLPTDQLSSIQNSFPNMYLGEDQQMTIASQFYDLETKEKHRIYLLDPVGNIMMSFAPSLNPRHIYFDLKKLLKATSL